REFAAGDDGPVDEDVTEPPAEHAAEAIPEEIAVAAAESEPPAEDVEAAEPGAESNELGGIIAGAEIQIALFAGAAGGEGAGGLAYSAARHAAANELRAIVVDMGRTPSDALGQERPGLCDLLTGSASFGEAIQRDEASGVHLIPFGPLGEDP